MTLKNEIEYEIVSKHLNSSFRFDDFILLISRQCYIIYRHRNTRVGRILPLIYNRVETFPNHH